MQDVVGVFLRVDDPHEHVDEWQQAIDESGVGVLDGVVVRQVEQDEAIEGLFVRALQLRGA